MPLTKEEVDGASHSCTHSTQSQDTGEPLAGAHSSKDLPNPDHGHCPALTLQRCLSLPGKRRDEAEEEREQAEKSSRNCHYHHCSCQSSKVPTSSFTMQGPTLTAPSALEHASAAHAPSFLPWHWAAAAPKHPLSKRKADMQSKAEVQPITADTREKEEPQPSTSSSSWWRTQIAADEL